MVLGVRHGDDRVYAGNRSLFDSVGDNESISGQRRLALRMKRRNVIVHIATSADGYIARRDGDLEWLTSRPAPKGFYGMNAFMKSIDTTLLGRKTYEVSLRMGAKFDSNSRTVVFSRHAPPPDAPSGVQFVHAAIRQF